MDYTRKVLDAIGVGGDRLDMQYCSAAEGTKFQETATNMHNKIKKLGPSPLHN